MSRRDDRAFIETAYRGLLGRDADEAGAQTYVDALRTGTMSREDVLRELQNSPEGLRGTLRSRARDEVFRSIRDSVPRPANPIVFLHIMKTGGTSLIHTLASRGTPGPMITDLLLGDLLSMPRGVLDQAAFLSGHLPFEATALIARSTRRCMVLRDPVERTLSHFAHLERFPAHDGETDGLTLDEFLTNPRWRLLWENYQARYLAHRIGLADGSWIDRFADVPEPLGTQVRTHPSPVQSLFDSTPFTMTEEELCEEATRNLGEIDFVGTTDALDELAADLLALHSEPVVVPRRNENPERVRSTDIAPHLLRVIRDGTRVDAELLAQARECRQARLPEIKAATPSAGA